MCLWNTIKKHARINRYHLRLVFTYYPVHQRGNFILKGKRILKLLHELLLTITRGMNDTKVTDDVNLLLLNYLRGKRIWIDVRSLVKLGRFFLYGSVSQREERGMWM